MISYSYVPEVWSNTKSIIWCTPELIVEINPTEYSQFGWRQGVPFETVKTNVQKAHEEYNNDVLITSEDIIGICDS